jgi:hypothetical protein
MCGAASGPMALTQLVGRRDAPRRTPASSPPVPAPQEACEIGSQGGALGIGGGAADSAGWPNTTDAPRCAPQRLLVASKPRDRVVRPPRNASLCVMCKRWARRACGGPQPGGDGSGQRRGGEDFETHRRRHSAVQTKGDGNSLQSCPRAARVSQFIMLSFLGHREIGRGPPGYDRPDPGAAEAFNRAARALHGGSYPADPPATRRDAPLGLRRLVEP